MDAVTALDYLQSLLAPSAIRPPQLILADEAGSSRGFGSCDDAPLDRLIRKRLDARSRAMRTLMRLLAGLQANFQDSN